MNWLLFPLTELSHSYLNYTTSRNIKKIVSSTISLTLSLYVGEFLKILDEGVDKAFSKEEDNDKGIDWEYINGNSDAPIGDTNSLTSYGRGGGLLVDSGAKKGTKCADLAAIGISIGSDSSLLTESSTSFTCASESIWQDYLYIPERFSTHIQYQLKY